MAARESGVSMAPKAGNCDRRAIATALGSITGAFIANQVADGDNRTVATLIEIGMVQPAANLLLPLSPEPTGLRARALVVSQNPECGKSFSSTGTHGRLPLPEVRASARKLDNRGRREHRITKLNS